MSDGKKTRRIEVGALARVEGEGALRLRVEGGRLTEVQLRIYEPPRFFEAFLRGRKAWEVPDITSRICGICPVAYQMSSVGAIERALGLEVPPGVRALRRLLYCGEWIESHVLHMFLLHAPDFLGFDSGLHMASKHPEAVQQALGVKKLGNALMTLIGGREIHPINVRVGGFYRALSRAELLPMREPLLKARDTMAGLTRFVAGLPFPDFEQPYELVSLASEEEYAIIDGRIRSTGGLDLPNDGWDSAFEEHQVPHSTALHAVRRDGGGRYLVGPLARYALNHARLTPVAAAVAKECGLGPIERNPFKSIVVRGIEVLVAIEESIRLIEEYAPPEAPFVQPVWRESEGAAATEAPRGLLFHRYKLDGQGLVVEARIVPPTSQNQGQIEDDLARFAGERLSLSDDALRRGCETIIRNHDPCISCSAHFLDLTVERG